VEIRDFDAADLQAIDFGGPPRLSQDPPGMPGEFAP
jgi:hypothetical protein